MAAQALARYARCECLLVPAVAHAVDVRSPDLASACGNCIVGEWKAAILADIDRAEAAPPGTARPHIRCRSPR